MDTGKVSAVAEVVKAAGGLGGYLAKVFGSIPEDALGLMVGDWLQHQRRRNLARLEAKTAEILKSADLHRITEPSPSVMIPILRAAADENRDLVQDLWAALLANSMKDGGSSVRHVYIDIVQKMNPADAIVVEVIWSMVFFSDLERNRVYEEIENNTDGFVFNLEFIHHEDDLQGPGVRKDLSFAYACLLAHRRGVSIEDYEISIQILQSLGVLGAKIFSTRYDFTPMGFGLVRACNLG